jgi:excisionase family DNA binding protein
VKLARKLYLPREVAALLRVHLSTVYRYVEAGVVPAVRLGSGRTLRVPVEEFHRRFPEIPREGW